jgi:predicted XRE-type DNA-binding protein
MGKAARLCYMRFTMSSNASLRFTEGSGNVFADLGLDNADELLAKADLMYAINREMARRALTPEKASKLTRLSESEISDIARGMGDSFSQQRLLDASRHLGLDLE